MQNVNESGFWQDILARIEAGESQAGLARAHGLSIGQFRYRLAKFMQDHAAGGEVAAAGEVIAQEESAQAAESPEASLVEQQVMRIEADAVVFDPSLFDETWPPRAARNQLVGLVKEPETMFCYWHLTEARKQLLAEHFQCAWEALPLYLYVYDVTDLHFNGFNAHESRRIPVQASSDRWYINGLTPGRRYVVDLGTTTWHGHCFTILRSQVCETPPALAGRGQRPQVMFGTLSPAAETLSLASSWQAAFDGYSLHVRRGGNG